MVMVGDQRKKDYSKLAHGIMTTSGIDDASVRRAIQAGNSTLQYLVRKVQDIEHYEFEGLKTTKKDISKRPPRKQILNPGVHLDDLVADSPSYTTATLTGKVNPIGLETYYYFRYGFTPETMFVQTDSVTLGDSNIAESISQNITGLTAGRIYYVELTAKNYESGQAYSEIKILVTGEFPEVVLT